MLQKIWEKTRVFANQQSGATSVEYAVILALIAGACIGVIVLVGAESGSFWNNNSKSIGDTFGQAGVGKKN